MRQAADRVLVCDVVAGLAIFKAIDEGPRLRLI
jgi:hypothetical protein